MIVMENTQEIAMSVPDHSTSESTEMLAAFIHRLQQLNVSVGQVNIDGRSLQNNFLALQQLYQQQLLPTLSALPTADAIVSFQTEINRALRLLGMDVSFVQSAKNSQTLQKRQAQMQQRISTLLEFAQGLQSTLQG